MYVAVASVLLVATGIYAAWWFQPQHIAPNSSMAVINVAYFGLLSLVVWRGLAHNLFLLWLVGGMRRPKLELPETGLRVAMITCFVPGKEPFITLETVATMLHDKGGSRLPVVDDEGRLLGIVSRGDLVRDIVGDSGR